MAKGSKKSRSRDRVAPSVERPRTQRVSDPTLGIPLRDGATAPPAPGPHLALTPAKAQKKCCRSQPRCKRCPVVLMRTARLQESGLTGKELKKALKQARAA